LGVANGFSFSLVRPPAAQLPPMVVAAIMSRPYLDEYNEGMQM
jgi:hypothetical protein